MIKTVNLVLLIKESYLIAPKRFSNAYKSYFSYARERIFMLPYTITKCLIRNLKQHISGDTAHPRHPVATLQ